MSAPLDRAELVEHLAADAVWVGIAEPDGQGVERALEWLWLCWGAGDSHLPLVLVHDLGHLLLRGRAVRFASGQDLESWPTDEQPKRLAYEDAVLGRWLRDPSVDAAHLALAGVPSAAQDAAIAHAICLALAEPLRGVDALVEGNPAFLRNSRVTLMKRHTTGVEVDPEWRRFAAEQRTNAIVALVGDRLFQPADIWELAHYASVPSASSRMALRQLHEVRDSVIAPGTGLLAHVKRRAQEVPIDDETAAQFPAGGFDGISQKGRFENLVRSEIGYTETEVLPGVADAFDVRFVLGELLFYTRDESPLLDAHRAVTVCIDQPARLRDKRPDLPVQTLVLAQGLSLALHRDMCRIFNRRAVTMHLRWRCHDAADRAIATEEMGLMSISLAEDLAHGRATAELSDAAHEDGHTIVLSPRAADGRRGRRTTWVRIDASAWAVSPPRGDPQTFDLTAANGVRGLLDTLLLAAVGALA